jgi:hypothetical protein
VVCVCDCFRLPFVVCALQVSNCLSAQCCSFLVPSEGSGLLAQLAFVVWSDQWVLSQPLNAARSTRRRQSSTPRCANFQGRKTKEKAIRFICGRGRSRRAEFRGLLDEAVAVEPLPQCMLVNFAMLTEMFFRGSPGLVRFCSVSQCNHQK